jgi:hypothetical protein
MSSLFRFRNQVGMKPRARGKTNNESALMLHGPEKRITLMMNDLSAGCFFRVLVLKWLIHKTQENPKK